MPLITILAATAAFLMRVIASLVFATGMGGLVSAITLSLVPVEAEAVSILVGAAGLLLAVTAGAGMMLLRWRTATRFRRSITDPGRSSLFVLFAVAALPLLAAAQSGLLIESWNDSLRTLDDMNLWELAADDPRGYALIPLVMVLAIPGWQTLTAASFLLTSVLVFLLRPNLVPRALVACVLIQAGLVGGCFFIGEFLETGGDLATQFLADEPTIVTVIQQFVAPRTAAANRIAWSMAAILIGYAVAWLWLSTRTETVSGEIAGGATISTRPLYSPPRTAFPAISYSAMPALGSLSTFIWFSGGYRISAGAADAVAFMFKNDRLVAEPNKDTILTMKRQRMLSTTREIRDASGQLLAIIQREDDDWFVLDDTGGIVTRTTRTLFQPRHCQFTMSMGDKPVARYTWRQMWFKPAMHIDFSEDDGRLDRRLAIALAMVLESNARISTFRKFGR